MNPIALDGPTVEPVSLAEMKAHLRLDGTDEDDLVTALVSAARLAVEATTRLVLIEQTWRLTLRRWPPLRAVALPVEPVLGLTAARIVEANGVATAIDLSLLRLDVDGDPARIIADVTAPSPLSQAGRIELDFTCGFGPGAASVPQSLRLAVRLLVARWFCHRGDDPDGSSSAGHGIPGDVRALIAAYIRPRLG